MRRRVTIPCPAPSQSCRGNRRSGLRWHRSRPACAARTSRTAAAARAQDPGNDTGFVYALKGNSTYEFYRYNIATNIWVTRESIPAYNRLMKKKGVKKGATLVQSSNGKLYAAKGGGTLDYWEYDPARPWGARWTQKADIPYGTRKLREGSGAVAVEVNGVDYIYFLKGSSTCEFYRYDSNTDVWETMAYAPTGPLNKTYKNGSCLTGDFDDTLFVLKGSYNEFAAYSISGNNWMTRETMPRIAPPGTRKKKVKDGAGIAYQGRNVFGLKGGNTNEFWAYRCDERKWYLAPEMPLAGGTTKRVKGGGALAYGRDGEARALYAFRGNNTLQLWRAMVRCLQSVIRCRRLMRRRPSRSSPPPAVRSSHSASRLTRSQTQPSSATLCQCRAPSASSSTTSPGSWSAHLPAATSGAVLIPAHYSLLTTHLPTACT